MTGPISTKQDEPFDPEALKHQILLLKSAHCMRPVVHQGRHQFIHGLTLNLTGSTPEMTVYLGGIPGGTASIDVQIMRLPAETEGEAQSVEGGEAC